uniref:Aspartate carbamoyltransferase n=1 Tax=Lygus hesperus TaxID=30085 RepID=A0A0A9YUA0_LYGHE
MYTIVATHGAIDGVAITFVGDLRYGRTVHSLLRALGLFTNVQVNLVPQYRLQVPEEVLVPVTEAITANGGTVQTYESLPQCLPHSDILYVTRIQCERIPTSIAPPTQEQLHEYCITADYLRTHACKSTLKILHPLPRVWEISTDVDSTPHAVYFDQMRYGLYMRIAILARIWGLEDCVRNCLKKSN